MAYFLGLDIGGSKISVGLVQFQGTKNYRLLKYKKIETDSKLKAPILIKTIKKIAAEYFSPQIRAIGLGIAGQIDWNHGQIRGSPNLSRALRNFKLRQRFAKEFGRPVVVDNDVHCFTLAEANWGAGRGYNSVFGLTIGTGIGGGLVIKGEIVRGATNTAGEIGHTNIGVQTSCSCGQRGHLEAIAGGRAMLRRYQALTNQDIKAQELEKLYQQGEQSACLVVREAAHVLAIGLANLLTLINPDCLVLGGGLVNFRQFISQAIKQVPSLLPFSFLEKTPILISKLGDQAGVLGAARLAYVLHH